MRLLDFGLAQFDEAETLTAVGDVPGTLAYISPERLRGEEAVPASDVWGVGILLWEALAGKHPFWGVPLPQMAGDDRGGRAAARSRSAPTCRSGCSPRSPARSRSTRRKRPPAAALAKELRAALAGRDGARRSVESVVSDTKLSLRLAPAAAGRRRRRGVGAAALPFYPTGWAPALAVVAAVAALRAPRAGLALALAVPVLPLGNLALGLALALRRASRSAGSRSPGATPALGLAFLAGPLLAPLGLLALVPLAVAGGARRRPARRAGASRPSPWPRSPPGCAERSCRSAQGAAPPLDLAGTESAVAAARALVGAVPPRLALEALALAAIAVAIPYARTPVADRRPRRRRARGYAARRAGRARAAARRRRLAHLRRRRSLLQVRALDSTAGGTSPLSMSVLRSIEQKIEGLFEGMFGRAFRTHVQPVELARKLAKEMDEHRTISVSRVYVPNEYSVYLSEADREQFTSYEGSLIGELQDYLVEHARRESYALLTPPKVLMQTDADLVDRRVRDRDADGAARGQARPGARRAARRRSSRARR